MAFKLGDVIIDRLQFGYGARKNGAPLYALTQLNNASINVTAETTDIKDKDGNLVYRKYHGKQAEVNATNAFVNFAVIEALSASEAEIASDKKKIKMPIIQTVDAGSTLDITGYVEGTVVVSALYKGAIDPNKEFTLNPSEASATSFAIKHNEEEPATDVLTPPTDPEEVQYLVKYVKEISSGAKIVNTADKFPKAHELYFKALAVDPCDKENFKAVVVRIPEFIPSPELTLALQGGDTQTMDYKGAILADTCSANKVLFEVYFIDEDEKVG